jgi:starch synthase
MSDPIKVLFLAAEAEPFIKVGGLADVAGSLPLALRALPAKAAGGTKLDVRLGLPLHRTIRVEAKMLSPVAELSVFRRGGALPVQVFEKFQSGMPVYLIDGEPLSSAPSVYSTDSVADRDKYTFFSLAILEMIRSLDWQPDIIHANDWHTALALYALHSRRNDPKLSRIRTLLTVHNLPYMGKDGQDVLAAYGLMPLNDEAVSMPEWARNQPLPLGLWAADAIVPVSPTYGREILTPEFGCGLETFLQTRIDDITGILNGLDCECWNPETDLVLEKRFNVDLLPLRVANRRALQKKLGLDEEPVPLLAMIGRIDRQKGIDVTFETLRRMDDLDWQFVILGSGDPLLEDAARSLQDHFPDRVRTVLRYDSDLSRRIYAGADMFLMPSRYEPCGLAQMIAMRYGCVPVVHATGGLKDTVREGRTGFLFQEAAPASMLEALRRAFDMFADPERWQRFQRNGMAKDFSWSRPARQYAKIYQSLTERTDGGET